MSGELNVITSYSIHYTKLYDAACFVGGILCFSGSLYLLILAHWPMGIITPLGGLLQLHEVTDAIALRQGDERREPRHGV